MECGDARDLDGSSECVIDTYIGCEQIQTIRLFLEVIQKWLVHS